MIILYSIIPLTYVIAIRQAFSFKGCLDPSLAQEISVRILIIDVLVKSLLWNFIDEFELYILCSGLLTFIFTFFCISSIYLNLKKQSNRFSKKYPNNINYTLKGVLYFVIGMLYLFLHIYFFTNFWIYERTFEIYLFLSLSFVSYSLFLFLYLLEMLRLDKLKILSLRSLSGLKSQRPPIVLLRSFEIDSIPFWNNKTIDEELCNELYLEENPIISLSNPDEILPTGGSIKIQAKDEYWKQVVIELLKSCKAVVLIEGRSNGLFWEISKLKEYLNHKQIYIYIPKKKYRVLAWFFRDNRNEDVYNKLLVLIFYYKTINNVLHNVWDDFSTLLSSIGLSVPKKFPGNNELIEFDTNWEGHVVKSKNYNQMWNYIFNRTNLEQLNEYNYSLLADKIISFEVNEHLPIDVMLSYSNQLKKFIRLSRVLILLLAVASFISFAFR